MTFAHPLLLVAFPCRYDEQGQKQRYFADDDGVDLKTLVKRAKYGDDAGDMDRNLAGNIARAARFKVDKRVTQVVADRTRTPRGRGWSLIGM